MNLFKIGFIAAGVANIGGVLFFSKLFSNQAMIDANPVVMSNFGLLMIIVWGFAYISVADSYEAVPWLSLLFTFEKLIYSLTWILWLQQNDLAILYTKDLFAGMFYTVYGFSDIVFMIFFGIAFWDARKKFYSFLK